MVKITPELIQASAQFVNPLKDRNKIDLIENLGATNDSFDTIDLSDNQIRKLDGFPLLKRLKTLFVNNNKISKIASDLTSSLPNLEELVLTNNNLQELGDVEPLVAVKSLRRLCLLKNAITAKQQYRLYVIHKLPQLRVLDFQKVKQKERDQAKEAFAGKRGQQFELDNVRTTRTFIVPGDEEREAQQNAPEQVMQSREQLMAIQEAISKATTLEEVQRLEALLRSGHVPKPGESLDEFLGRMVYGRAPKGNTVVEEEDDDDDNGNKAASSHDALTNGHQDQDPSSSGGVNGAAESDVMET